MANSTAAQRGLAGLFDSAESFRVVERLDWSARPSEAFHVMVGELQAGCDPFLLTEPFVVLSSEVVLEPGAGRAVLHPEATDQAVLAAVNAVLAGLSVQDSFHLRGPEPTAQPHDLTERELDVLNLLGEGLSNRQISEALHISPNTVKFHLSSIFSKLQVSSRAEAVTAGLRSGILML